MDERGDVEVVQRQHLRENVVLIREQLKTMKVHVVSNDMMGSHDTHL